MQGYPFRPNGLPVNPTLPYHTPAGTGGYNPAAYAALYPGMGYPVLPQAGGHINPAFMLNRQALFRPVSGLAGQTGANQAQNEAGYAYSAAYLAQQAQAQAAASTQAPEPSQDSLPPSKRQRTSSRPSSTRGRPAFVPGSREAAAAGSWRNCVEPGCSFVGPEKEVQLHEQDRHLIYRGGKTERSEEEEAMAKRGGPPPPIPGTSITLNTPEDIEKWIAQRRANWPTAKRVEEKERERREAKERGELEGGGGRGGRGRGRGRGGARGKGGGRGGRSGDVGRQSKERAEKVNGAVPQEKDTASDDDASSLDEGDEEGDDIDLDLAGTAPPPPGTKPEALMSAERRALLDQRLDAGDNGAEDVEANPTGTHGGQERKPRRVCKFFAQSGRCRNGAKCGFLHERGEQSKSQRQEKNIHTAGLQLQVHKRNLLGSLLETPIAQTLSQLSQVITFLVANDFLDGVELRVGQAEEVERIRGRVKVVSEGDVKVQPDAGHGNQEAASHTAAEDKEEQSATSEEALEPVEAGGSVAAA